MSQSDWGCEGCFRTGVGGVIGWIAWMPVRNVGYWVKLIVIVKLKVWCSFHSQTFSKCRLEIGGSGTLWVIVGHE